MEQIELKGMEFHSYIGHYDEEKDVGTDFKVDLIIETDCKTAGISDNLKDALDYQKIYKIVKTEMQNKCNLIENVCSRTIDTLLNNFQSIENVKIKVSKMNPALGGKIESVSVIMSKKRP